jgi:hypothetical protein
MAGWFALPPASVLAEVNTSREAMAVETGQTRSCEGKTAADVTLAQRWASTVDRVL